MTHTGQGDNLHLTTMLSANYQERASAVATIRLDYGRGVLSDGSGGNIR